jgi:LuxR family maltose regulon positive regulatory protein
MPQPLLATKLLLPPLRPGLVSRPRLLAALDEGLQPAKRLILLTAPPGYGKTTLLVEWVSGFNDKWRKTSPARVPSHLLPVICWFSLDDSDNDLPRFLAYLIEAVSGILPDDQAEACRSIQAAIHSSPQFDSQGFLIALVNYLQQLPCRIVLILDDYHAIQDAQVHQAIQFLIKNQPQNFRLVIATRSDPPLGLAQLRGRGQLCEIRMAELVFTSKEATEFLNHWMALELSAEDIDVLHERTEGWVAGLQMAALALKTPALTPLLDRSTFIRDFHGSHRHILEYLTEEVFNQQPEAVQSFLLCTSVLERFNGPLCEAILQDKEGKQLGTDKGITFPLPLSFSGQDFLERLERNNLFLVSLDSEHEWFRYHPLFADLLKARLKHSYPGAMKILLVRAARWNEQQGWLVEAFSQALASTDFWFAADLFEQHILTFFYQSEITQVHRWLSALPKEILLSRPLLCAVYAAVIALQSPYPPQSLSAAEKWMQEAEKKLSSGAGYGDLARAFAMNIRSYWARFRGEQPERVIDLIQRAMKFLPAGSVVSIGRYYLCIHSALQTNLGFTYWEMGDELAAGPAFIQASKISRACGDLFNETASIYYQAKINGLHGRLGEAASLCREALEHFSSQPAGLGHSAPYSGEIGVQLAEILLEQNQLAEAERLLNENIELAKWTTSHNILLYGFLALARLAAARSNFPTAFSYLAEAERLSNEGSGVSGAQRARLCLVLIPQGAQYLEQAQQWARDVSLVEFQKGPPQIAWNAALALAHLIITEDDSLSEGNTPKLAGLLEWLGRQGQAMQTRGWAHWEIQLRVVECLARQKMGDQPGALYALQRALELGEPSGYVRLFLEEGEPLRELLLKLAREAGGINPYLHSLLATYPVPSERQAHSPTSREGLVEPLTNRELEVLRLISVGLSNQQIADRLVLTLNTVKKHNYSIFQKLGVSNRAQAILAMRKMGLDNGL